jgi:arginyl-tRNA synthetase
MKTILNLMKLEVKIIRKVFEWPKIIESASRKFDLHKIPFYLYELSTLFHAYWSKGNEDKNYKFIENEKIKRKEILLVINLVAIVIQNGMKILGVSLPKKCNDKSINIFFSIILSFFLLTYKYYSSNKNIEAKRF